MRKKISKEALKAIRLVGNLALLGMFLSGVVLAQGTGGWQLVWSDEFNGAGNSPPDPGKWSYDLGRGTPLGWGNSELESYSNSLANVFQDGNGNLVIRALKTADGYTSGRIETQNKFAFLYGRVTARIKLPYAQGIWPAFWLLGAAYPDVPWPDCSEIDIMENFGVQGGDGSRNRGTVHGPGDTGVGISGQYVLPNGRRFADDFHVFTVDWTPQGVDFYVDGNLYLTLSASSLPAGWNTALSKPFFLILNVAVGGSPAPVGYPDGSTGFPQDMLIDYVRIYQPLTLATRFVPVAPCRLADTRAEAGPLGGPSLAANQSRTLVVSNSACGIPANAAAYSLNVAVVPRGELGYLTLWAADQARPRVATLSSDGRIKSNAAIIPAGTNGGISLFATDATDVVIDINGYFVSGAIDPNGLAFYPLTPCRILDTRGPSGPLGGPGLLARTSRSFPVLDSSCNVPPQAVAYSLNFAAVPRRTLAYLTAWPTGDFQPLVASLNAPTGTVTSNAVIVRAGTSGKVSIYATDDADLVADITGYFGPPGPNGLSLYLDVPCRLSDTREAALAYTGTVLNLDAVGGPCAASAATGAWVFNVTAIPSAPLGYVTMWAQGMPQPVTAMLNALDQAITSNLAIVPTTDGSIDVFSSDPTNLVFDLFGFFAP